MPARKSLLKSKKLPWKGWALIPVSIEIRLTSSLGSLASWMSIFKPAAAEELITAESLFSRSLILETFGVFLLPGTGTVLWKRNFKGVLDHGRFLY